MRPREPRRRRAKPRPPDPGRRFDGVDASAGDDDGDAFEPLLTQPTSDAT